MPSEVDLCNDALGQIGQSPITSLSDGSTNANYATTFYPNLRDSLLMNTNWTFNRKRVQLAQLPTPPLYEFAYQYQLPADFLKLVEYLGDAFNPNTANVLQLFDTNTDPSFERYKVEGRTLLTNDSIVFITYSKQITDPNFFSPLLYQCMTSWLAAKLASAINKDSKLSMSLLKVAMDLLSEAMSVDGQQDSIDPFVVPDLRWGR